MDGILFIHPDCSARFGHLAAMLAKQGHRVFLLTGKESRQDAAIEGVEQRVYGQGPKPRKSKRAAGKEASAIAAVAQACGALSQDGFEPALVCAAACLSSATSLRSLFPAARFVVDFEGLRIAGQRDDARPDPAVLGELEACDLGLVPTRITVECFPPALRGRLAVLHEGIDTDLFAPTDALLDISGLPDDAPLIVCSPDGTESEERIAVMLQAMEKVLTARADVHLVIVPADPGAKSSSAAVRAWKKRLTAGKLPKDRVHSIGGLREEQRCRLFGRAAVFLCPDAPAGPSRTLLEAMSSGSLVTAPADPALAESLTHDVNALLCNFNEIDTVAEMIQWALVAGYTTRLREAARQTVLDQGDCDMVMRELERLLAGESDIDVDDDDDDDDIADGPTLQDVRGQKGGAGVPENDDDADDYDDDDDDIADGPMVQVVRGQKGGAGVPENDDDADDYDDDDDDDILDGLEVQVVRGQKGGAGVPENDDDADDDDDYDDDDDDDIADVPVAQVVRGQKGGIDWIVPLSGESKSNNDELRLLLRSLEKNARNLGRVILVGDNLPDWVTNVVRLSYPDTLKTNKDGNLINKVVYACNSLELKEFVLSADDNLLCRPCDLDKLPLIYNPRGVEDFGPNFQSGEWNRWYQRMMRTFWFAEELGMPLRHNYETHAPQLFRNAPLLLKRVQRVRYAVGIGYSIYTLFRLMLGETGGEPQDDYKVTWETAEQVLQPPTKLFANYNDATFLNGLREWLFLLYSEKSHYEK